MDRRGLLVGGAALAAWAGLARGEAADDLRGAAREGWLYALPLIEAARLRAALPAAVNAFVHLDAEAAARRLGAPEADVLYSVAFINVPNGGVATLTLPPSPGRYLSVAVLDMYGNVLKVLGGGATGSGGGAFRILGPPSRVGMGDYTVPQPRLPPMHKMIQTPGPWVWTLARVQVRGDDDLTLAQATQSGLSLTVKPREGAPPPRPAPAVAPDAPWGDYFYAAQRLIDEDAPPPYEAGFFRRIAPLQLGMDGGFEQARFADTDISHILEGVADARTLAGDPRVSGVASNDWLWPKPKLGVYGQDFLYRAQSARVELGAMPPAETFVARALAPDGALSFASDGYYRVTLPGPPPCDGFWSLSLYAVAENGALTAPQTRRRAVGSHTPGLSQRPDGGLDIWIGRPDPGGDHATNWLQAPDNGRFALLLRAYLPADGLLAGKYVLAPAARLDTPQG
ncbi:MAG TPA: DUF1254 domain-containing protein [Caulobacteraceae bacterium]|jgi:hypothetical protein